MAAVARDGTKIGNVLVIATDKTYRETPLLVDCERGQRLKLTSTGWRLASAGERANGVAMKKGHAGQVGFDILTIGEQDGYSGLTPGVSLYPSATLDGELDTTAVNGFSPQVLVRRPSRISINCLV
jgi:hypothetical protein